MPRRKQYRRPWKLTIIVETTEAHRISEAAGDEGISMTRWLRQVLLAELQRLDVLRKLETTQTASQ